MLEQQRKYRQKAGVTELKPKAKTPENQQIYYYHTDHLGTPQELTDQDGDIVWSAHYHAWGRVHSIERPQKLTYTQHGNTITESWVAAEQIEQPLRFQGQYHDSETGLHYNRYRYYDPDIGRFISQDPIGLLGGINLYQYAPNPVGWVDPFGLCPDKVGDIPLVNNRKPINSKYAGETHPSGVKFNDQGFPDFSPYTKAQVDIKGLTGNYAKDALMANKAVGLSKTPPGYVWHHVENAKTMQLIPKDIHNAVRHTGGAAILRGNN